MQSESTQHDQKTQYTQQILNNTTNTLEDIRKLARETKSIATNTANELDKEGEQLANMKKQMNEIDNDMVDAKKTIRNMEFKWYDPRTWVSSEN